MVLAVAAGSVVFLTGGTAAPPAKKKLGPDPKEWNRVVDKAIAYLKTNQAEDGSWDGKRSPGISGIVLTGMLQTGRVTVRDPTVEKGLKFVDSLINRKAGHIAGRDPKVGLQNYVTCVNLMALVAADRKTYKSVIGDASKFLKKLQWDEGEGKDPKSDFYGGAGYDSKSRPDLSNTQFFLDALVAAGIPKDDPAFKKALVFVSRCQNLKGEADTRPWADKINDGSFIYSAASNGPTKVVGQAGRWRPARLRQHDLRWHQEPDLLWRPQGRSAYQKGVRVDSEELHGGGNPGMPGPREWGLYYYYHTMAKCLDVLGVDEVVDARRHSITTGVRTSRRRWPSGRSRTAVG